MHYNTIIMFNTEDSDESEGEPTTGVRSVVDLDTRRRSFLRGVGGGVGLAALGGSAIGTAGGTHDGSPF
jgi:hypothetical protein